jgi:nitroreductase/NAD-dependent dihydropyrimidine dehydrogenase PreA subunit
MALPSINRKKCTVCGRCVVICPRNVLQKSNNVIETSGDCMLCSHCYAVCPADAISFPDELVSPSFQTFKYRERYLKPGEADTGLLVNLLRSRRSVRKYLQKPVPSAVLADLVEASVASPSGSNCQKWQFTIINGSDGVRSVANGIGAFYEKLNRLAANPFARALSVVFMGKKLINYYNNNYQSVTRAIEEARQGKDRLFHGAPALIIIHNDSIGSTPLLDPQYAAYALTLVAHTMGLGTCFIGYATESLNRVKKLKKLVNVPESHTVHAVLTVGYPSAVFVRPTLRKKYSYTCDS